MAKNDNLGVLLGIILGVIGLVALAKILSETKCPRCNSSNPNSNTYCQKCGYPLK